MLAGMSERRMPNVVNQGQSLSQVRIEIERAGDRAGDLRYFERVREAIAEMIGVTNGEDLGLRFEAAECARMDDAVAIASVVVAIAMRRLRPAATGGASNVHGVRSERHRRIVCQGGYAPRIVEARNTGGLKPKQVKPEYSPD